jgi:hypothetical protein
MRDGRRGRRFGRRRISRELGNEHALFDDVSEPPREVGLGDHRLAAGVVAVLSIMMAMAMAILTMVVGRDEGRSNDRCRPNTDGERRYLARCRGGFDDPSPSPNVDRGGLTAVSVANGDNQSFIKNDPPSSSHRFRRTGRPPTKAPGVYCTDTLFEGRPPRSGARCSTDG